MNILDDLLYLAKFKNIEYTHETIKTLFNFLNNQDYLLKNINKNIIYNNNFIKHLFVRPDLSKALKNKFDLLDLYYEKINLENDKYKIEQIYKTINIEIYDNVWEIIKNENFYEDKENLEILNNDLDFYKYFILNKKWVEKKKFKFDNKNIDLILKELLLMYYDDLFLNDKELIIDNNKDYDKYIYLISFFKDIYNKGFYKKINVSYNDNSLENNYLNFLYFCVQNKLVNKNLIMWTYIICNEIIEDSIINDYFFVIINQKEDSLGFIEKILQYYDEDYVFLNEEKLNKILDTISDEKILGKIREELNLDYDIKSIFNNINFLKIFNKNNSNMRYQFIDKFDIEKININFFFVFFILTPLELNLDLFKIKMREVKKKTEIIKEDTELIKILNSLFFFNNKNDVFECIYINSFDKEIKRLKYENVSNYFEEIINTNFNKTLLFDRIVNFFGNHEIILNRDSTIKLLLRNYF